MIIFYLHLNLLFHILDLKNINILFNNEIINSVYQIYDNNKINFTLSMFTKFCVSINKLFWEIKTKNISKEFISQFVDYICKLIKEFNKV